MARQEHEHGFLGNIGQAYARDVSGGIEAQGRPQADAQPRCLQAEDLADGTGGGVDDPVARTPSSSDSPTTSPVRMMVAAALWPS